MKALLFMGLMGFSSICVGQDYEKLYSTKGYFQLENDFATCKTTLALSKKKADRLVNYQKALEYQAVDFIFVHVRRKNMMYNPVTPCRLVADSTAPFGWYLVTLEELSAKGRVQDYTNTWTPPFDKADFRIYEKACFDRILIQYQANR